MFPSSIAATPFLGPNRAGTSPGPQILPPGRWMHGGPGRDIPTSQGRDTHTHTELGEQCHPQPILNSPRLPPASPVVAPQPHQCFCGVGEVLDKALALLRGAPATSGRTVCL